MSPMHKLFLAILVQPKSHGADRVRITLEQMKDQANSQDLTYWESKATHLGRAIVYQGKEGTWQEFFELPRNLVAPLIGMILFTQDVGISNWSVLSTDPKSELVSATVEWTAENIVEFVLD